MILKHYGGSGEGIKAPHRGVKEEDKNVAEWNVQDAIRRVEAANWTNSILK
jgi:hypothetical protein